MLIVNAQPNRKPEKPIKLRLRILWLQLQVLRGIL
jgi:hypothetical protein